MRQSRGPWFDPSCVYGEKQVRMIMKYHNQRPQTYTCHCGKEIQNIDSYMTARAHLK